MRRQPIYGLDLVRFLAAAAVLFYHLGFKAFAVPDHPLHVRIGGEAALPSWAGATWWGWIGVQVFFVISGLVIAYSAEGASWRSFLRSRVSRLLPAMLICATLIAIVLVTWGGVAVASVAILWAKSVVFFPMGPWLAGQFWTLPIEIFFYAIVWLMIVGQAGRHLEALAWALGLISAAYWGCLAVTGAVDTFGRLTQLAMLQHGCYFAIGILLSVVDRNGLTPGRIALGLICLAPAWLQISASAIAEKPGYGLSAMSVWPFFAWLTIVAMIAASLYWKDHVAKAVGRHGNAIRTMGLITYPLYLVHMHVGGPVLVEMLALGAPSWAALAAAFASSVLVAWIIASLIEPPLHRWVAECLKAMLPDPARYSETIGKTEATTPAIVTPVKSGAAQ